MTEEGLDETLRLTLLNLAVSYHINTPDDRDPVDTARRMYDFVTQKEQVVELGTLDPSKVVDLNSYTLR